MTAVSESGSVLARQEGKIPSDAALSRRRRSDAVDLFLAAALLIFEGFRLRRAWRQRARLRPLGPGAFGGEADDVGVVVPARNEAHNIEGCLEGLLAQTYPTKNLWIVVVYDESDDGADRVVEAIARRAGNLRLLRSGPLRKGWTGKTQACWTCASACGEPEWLCFIDADMRAEPALVARAVAEGRRGADFLSLAPRHRLVGFAERLMIPCGLYLLGFQQDLGSASPKGSEDVTVAGQFLLVRRRVYGEVGGHAAVCGAICEDLELAMLVKMAGASVALRDGSALLSTRMYCGWSDLWPGFAKNALEMFGGPRKTLLTAASAVLLSRTVVALPAASALRPLDSPANRAALFVAAAAAAAAVGFHVAGAVHFRIPFWFGFLFPAAYTIGAAIALDGLRLRLAGRVRSKGRLYR